MQAHRNVQILHLSSILSIVPFRSLFINWPPPALSAFPGASSRRISQWSNCAYRSIRQRTSRSSIHANFSRSSLRTWSG